MSATAYAKLVLEVTQTIADTQMNAISKTAGAAANSIANGGILHVFGSGHSHMAAEDVFFRAGGLACVNAMLEYPLMELNAGRTSSMERLHGYAEVIMSGYRMEAGEVAIIVSNSGINAVPIEIAAACKKRGMTVAAITSLRHSEAVASRHKDGLKLAEIADIVIDNGGVPGDAALQTDAAVTVRYGPTSTLSAILIMQMIVAEIVASLVERGFTPPMFKSANQPGAEGNDRLLQQYQDRVRYFPKR